MAGFFSVRLAPGLRVSASRRGLRSHIGPRGARLHVGGGGTGVSTGAGPFTYYQSLSSLGGSSQRRRTGRATGRLSARGQRKAERARGLAAAIEQINGLHRQSFPPAQPPVAGLPDLPDEEHLVAQLERQHLAGLWFWQFSARRAARQAARAQATEQLAAARAAATQAQQEEQARLDRQWQLLLENDPDAVLAALAASFEDNQAPAAPVGVDGQEAHIVVLVPDLAAVPERYPTTTQAGNLSIRTMSMTDRWALYRQLVAGHGLVSAREALAVAPALARVSVVVLRDDGPDVYGRSRASAVLATRLSRQGLQGIRWQHVSAWDVIDQVGQDTLLNTWGRARRIRPLDLTGQPELADLIDAIDLDELDDAVAQ